MTSYPSSIPLWQASLTRPGEDSNLRGGVPLSPGEGAQLIDCGQELGVSLRGQILTV